MKRVKNALSRFWTRARGLARRGRGGDGRGKREKSPGNGVLPRLIPLAAGAFWLWFFARKDVYRPEQKRLLALTFFLGVVSAVPAAAIEYVFIADSDFAGMAFWTLAANMLFVVGPVEEIAKFLAVRLGAYRSLRFDEPGDGLVYAAAAGLGFASIENLGCVLAFGPAVMILRAPLSTVARVVFGGFWGYALGLRAGGGEMRSGFWVVAVGLLAASAAHGMFNIAASATPLAAIALTALGVWWTLSRFDWAAARCAVPIQAQLPQNRLRRLRTAHIRDKPLPPSARRRTPPSRRPLLRTMQRRQQTGRRLLRRLRRQVRSVRKARLETGNQPARGAERQAAGAVMPLANFSRSRIIRIA